MTKRGSRTSGPSCFGPTMWSCLGRVAQGDKDAQDMAFRLYYKPVLKFLERRTPRTLDAEEIANQVMHKLLQPEFLSGLDPSKGRFRDYLLQTTRNVASNALKHERAKIRGGGKARVSLQDLPSDPPASRSERHEWAQELARSEFDEAMERFKKDAVLRGSPEHDVLCLFCIEGLSHKEIAEKTGLSVTTVNNHVHRGRKRLEGYLREVVREAVPTPEEVEEELAFVRSVFSGKR